MDQSPMMQSNDTERTSSIDKSKILCTKSTKVWLKKILHTKTNHLIAKSLSHLRIR